MMLMVQKNTFLFLGKALDCTPLSSLSVNGSLWDK